MIKVYSGLKGNMVLLFFIAGLVLVVSMFFWGIAGAIQFILPLLIVLSYLLIVVFVGVILPATSFKDLCPSLGLYSSLMSHALGISTWMMSFLFVMKAFGLAGIFLALLFQFLAPVALVGAMFQGSWKIAVHLSIWISFTYAMKFYSQWLLNLNPRKAQKSNIIDVDALEVEDPGER